MKRRLKQYSKFFFSTTERNLIKNKEKIKAIKLYRKRTGGTLRQALIQMRKYEESMGIKSFLIT